MSNIVGEASKQIASYFEIMRQHPLALSLVVSNFLLIAYIFYSGASVLTQRRETVDLIVKWQSESDRLMASCVSADIMKLVLDALNRDRDGQSGRKPAELEKPQVPEAK